MSFGSVTIKTLLISSEQDPAGSNIHTEIMSILPEYTELSDNISHMRTKERLIYLDGPSLPSDVDQIVFLSRHSSRDPRPVLTVHVTGNYGEAKYGGKSGKLTPSATRLMHALISNLVLNAPDGFEVMYEATHHGPTCVPVPSCFVEIGSTEREWNDIHGSSAVARSVLNALMHDTHDVISLAGFGGTHYAIRQTEISKSSRGGFGHIMPSRDICYLTSDMFKDITTATNADAIYIDGKALASKDEHSIIKMASDLNLPVLGQSDLKQLSDLTFVQYLNIRKMADEKIPGSHIVVHALKHADNPMIIEIQEDLLEEVIRRIPETFLSSLDSLPIVHLTGLGKACHNKFITDIENSDNIKEKLISLCISFLQREYDSSFDGNCLVIRKNRFDPEKANELKIPAGPLYGELMKGRPVSVNGRMIMPQMVMTSTEKCIRIRRDT